jgi:hypothetical protein
MSDEEYSKMKAVSEGCTQLCDIRREAKPVAAIVAKFELNEPLVLGV